MPQETHVLKQLDALKAETEALHKLWQSAAQAMDTGRQTGDLQSAQNALAELEVKTEEFKKFRATLSPEVLFVAKYNVEVHGPHEVSFVLPKEVSRLEMIKEAYALVGDRDLVEPRVLNAWEEDVGFTAVASASQRIHIDGHVEGGDGKTREEQEAFLRAQGRQMPSTEDLAVAFVAHYMATGEPLFGSYQDRGFSYTVRAAGGALRFFTYGLGADGVDDRNSREQVAVAAHVRPADG